LHDLGLVTDTPETCYLGADQGTDGPLFVEIFEWTGRDAAARAHTHPSVSEIWERMELLCERRDGRPSMEFPHVRRLVLR
jgi:hypothetical protein